MVERRDASKKVGREESRREGSGRQVEELEEVTLVSGMGQGRREGMILSLVEKHGSLKVESEDGWVLVKGLNVESKEEMLAEGGGGVILPCRWHSRRKRG